jgi:hypothetical protein
VAGRCLVTTNKYKTYIRRGEYRCAAGDMSRCVDDVLPAAAEVCGGWRGRRRISLCECVRGGIMARPLQPCCHPIHDVGRMGIFIGTPRRHCGKAVDGNSSLLFRAPIYLGISRILDIRCCHAIHFLSRGRSEREAA